MTPKEKTLKLITEKMAKSTNGMFATYGTLEEVTTYALNLLKSSSLQERDFAAYTVMGIYHNTLINLLTHMIIEAFEEADKPDEVDDESDTTKV